MSGMSNSMDLHPSIMQPYSQPMNHNLDEELDFWAMVDSLEMGVGTEIKNRKGNYSNHWKTGSQKSRNLDFLMSGIQNFITMTPVEIGFQIILAKKFFNIGPFWAVLQAPVFPKNNPCSVVSV